MENHWQDFDHDLTQQLVDFTDNLPHEEATIANQLRQAILKRVSQNFRMNIHCADVRYEDPIQSWCDLHQEFSRANSKGI